MRRGEGVWPGVDSIGFGYRKGQPDFWALHWMVGEEVLVDVHHDRL